MKKIGILVCLLFLLLGGVRAENSKDIMIKYKYTDNVSKHTKEVVDNKVEYELNDDKVRILLDDSVNKDLNIILFEVSEESLQWLKTKIEIKENANVYHFKILNNDEIEIEGITVKEYSDNKKIIKIYDEKGNRIEKISSKCYIVIEQNEDIREENINLYNDSVVESSTENTRDILIIFLISAGVIFTIFCVIIIIRKEKK